MSGAALALALAMTTASLGGGEGAQQQQQASLLPEPLPPIAALAAEELDPCALLIPAEVAAVQGEPVREARAHRQAGGGTVRLSCFYTLPTFSRSVSLELTVADGAANRAPSARELWEQRFGRERPEVEEAAHAMASKEEDHEEEAQPPLVLEGVGDQAFWVGSPLTGALYALQGDAILRISIGGADGSTRRIERATTLARHVMPRLAPRVGDNQLALDLDEQRRP
ncbi:MAG TPA: hypothetical protein VGS57_03430 [Thermoanaerobaculia bacterium]|nr:hypothetical protein [Thermoanaerobaculia bacterium]